MDPMGNVNVARNDRPKWEEDGGITSLMDMANTTKCGGKHVNMTWSNKEQSTMCHNPWIKWLIQNHKYIWTRYWACYKPSWSYLIISNWSLSFRRPYSNNTLFCPFAIIAKLACKEN
jgi:hypothetical protein